MSSTSSRRIRASGSPILASPSILSSRSLISTTSSSLALVPAVNSTRLFYADRTPFKILYRCWSVWSSGAAVSSVPFRSLQQVEPVLSIAVHFIDEYDHGCPAHGDHFHQAPGLLPPVHAVDHQYNAVDRREGTIGIFGKVLVTGRIQQVDKMPWYSKVITLVATLIPRCRSISMKSLVACFWSYCSLRPGRLDGAAEQQEFLGKGCFTGIRVRDNGEGLALIDFTDILHVLGNLFEAQR